MDESAAILTPVFTAGQIARRVAELGSEINAAYGQEPLLAICVLKGAFMFFSDLARHIENPGLELDFVRLASYGMNSKSSKHIIFSKDIELDILGKNVLIVEDIVDSGHTMKFLIDNWYIILAALAVLGAGGAAAYRYLKLPSEEQLEKVRQWLLTFP